MKNSISFSVITPSFNQGQFIDATIQSVLRQGYDNYEHLVLDGGSTDNTLAVLANYPHLKTVSEKDKGQSDALNKGFRMATGEVIAWLNSDDTYEPGAFHAVADFFSHHPESSVVFGDFNIIDRMGNVLSNVKCRQVTFKDMLKRGHSRVGQPALFFRKKVIDTIGCVDEGVQVGMDYEFFLRMIRAFKFEYIPKTLANFRRHDDSKTVARIQQDISYGYEISKQYGGGRYLSLHMYVLLRRLYYLHPRLGHFMNDLLLKVRMNGLRT